MEKIKSHPRSVHSVQGIFVGNHASRPRHQWRWPQTWPQPTQPRAFVEAFGSNYLRIYLHVMRPEPIALLPLLAPAGWLAGWLAQCYARGFSPAQSARKVRRDAIANPWVKSRSTIVSSGQWLRRHVACKEHFVQSALQIDDK